jgi:hypothetical protein
MDDYPEHLSPPKDQWGGIDKNKFATWWEKVKSEFPTVPHNVGQYFLHEHWGRSPYGSMKSRAYKFEAVKWESSRLFEIRSTWDDFDPECKGCIVKGRELATVAERTNKAFAILIRNLEKQSRKNLRRELKRKLTKIPTKTTAFGLRKHDDRRSPRERSRSGNCEAEGRVRKFVPRNLRSLGFVVIDEANRVRGRAPK